MEVTRHNFNQVHIVFTNLSVVQAYIKHATKVWLLLPQKKENAQQHLRQENKVYMLEIDISDFQSTIQLVRISLSDKSVDTI